MDYKALTAVCFGVFFLNFVIWLGIFFGIYHPFFIEFSPATCQVKQDLWTSSSYGYRLRQQSVRLTVDGKDYLAVMCESDANTLEPATSDYMGYYAYNWVYCPLEIMAYEYCMYYEQVIPPRWMCGDLSDDLQQEGGDEFKCWYKSDFHDIDNMILESDWTLGFYYLNPQSRTVAMRQESPNYPETDYLALHIVCLGVFAIPSFLCVVLIGIPGQKNWICCKKAYRACRRGLDCCWRYYDPTLIVQDRRALFAYASKSSPALKCHRCVRRELGTYFS